MTTNNLDANLGALTSDELDAILERTEYAEYGVAIGAQAAADQDLRRAVQAEAARRYGIAV